MFRKGRWLTFALAATVLAAGCDDDDDGGPTDVPDPPAAPTGATATVGQNSVQVTWNSVSDATAYDVQRRNIAGGGYTTIAPDQTGSAYTDQGLAPGSYDYRVMAKNANGSSSPSDPTNVVIIEEEDPSASLSGTITGVRTLSADTAYTLVGIVLVADGGRLNIPAGTTLYGGADVLPTAALIVQQGGRLYSEGTEEAPVIFTSPSPSPAKGDWGGVVLNGRSICNFPADDCVGEGLSGPYGGDDLGDNSGRIVYTRIEYAGYEVSFGNELNALTLNGVGSGTEIHHVQTHAGLDDGFEWFGGTVDTKYLIASDISDDSFDFSTGFHGRGQFWIAQQDPNDADNGYEVDGNEDDSDYEPWTNPQIYNVTLVGKGANGAGGTAGESTRGILLRLGTAGMYANHIITGFGTAGLDLDNPETINRITADSLNIVSSIVFSNAVNFDGDNDGIDEEATFLEAAWGNRVEDPQLGAPFNRNNPDFRPAASSPAANGHADAPNDGFFDPVDYIGAVEPDGPEWYKEAWTRWGS